MHQETKSELINSGTTAMAGLLKELFVHRNQMQQMEQQKEMELELAKAKSEARSESDDDHAESHATQSVGRPPLQHLKDQEDCSICLELLEAIEEADQETQVEALTEYGKLKYAVETGGSQEEIKNVLRQSNTLQNLLEAEMQA